MADRMLSTREAAELLGLSRRTLECWRTSGAGPRFVKLNAAVRYRPEDLDAFMLRARSTSEVTAQRRAG